MLIYILSLSGAILLLLTLIATTIYIIYLIISWFYGAPYVPTATSEVKTFVQKIKVPKNAHMIELGCGDGRVLRIFAKEHGVKGRGYDINPIVLTIARISTYFQKLDLSFHNKDIRTLDLSKYDIIYIFLFPKLIHELKDQIMNVKPGAIIISHGFKIPFLEKERTHTYQGKKFKTFVYHKQ